MIRTNRTWRVAAAAAAAGLTLAACGTTEDSSDDNADGGSGSGGDCSGTIAYVGPLTGDYANLGQNMLNGANLALEQFKEENPDCDVTLKEVDSQGDPEKATPLVSDLVQDQEVIGVVGPSFSGETEATGPTFAEAGLVTVSPSATNPGLSQNGWDTFHRVLGNDDTQAPAAAKYISDTLGAQKVFVVDDASEYGKFIAEGVAGELGDLVIDTDTVQQKQKDFSATVTKVKSSGADALFYGGYYAEAGKLAKQLKNGGWEGTFVSGDGSLDKGFVEEAGSAGDGAVLTCPCAPADEEFTSAYTELSGAEPGTYSTEAYDATNILLSGIAEGNTDRESLLEWVNGYDDAGITKQIKFDETGEVSEVTVYAYKVEGGEIQPGEPIE
jgi:branched-chain amino acid transport system substrate-binding protein